MNKFIYAVGLLLAVDTLIATNAQAQDDKTQILAAISKFSAAFVAGDYQTMIDAYTDDALLMAPAEDPIKGKEGIAHFWNTRSYKQLQHRLEPVEIIINGDTAIDYGFIYGQSETNGVVGKPGSSKYYVIWKKVNGQWKIYFDMWNARDAEWKEKN